MRIVNILLFSAFLLLCTSALDVDAEYRFKMSNGVVDIFVEDIASSSNIQYVTTGWIVHREKQYGIPTSKAYGTIDKVYEVSTYPSPIIPGEPVQTVFRLDEQDVRKALIDANMSTLSNGDRFYLSAIFQVRKNSVLNSQKYLSLNSIQYAEKWANVARFEQYYDIPIKFESAEYPVKMKWVTSNKILLKNELLGYFRAGESFNYNIKKNVKLFGLEYRLHSSYVTLLEDNKNEIMYKNEKVTNRTIVVPISGVTLYVIYQHSNIHDTSIKIGSNKIRFEKYDVPSAIPSNENLFIQVKSKSHFIHCYFIQTSGIKRYKVKVTRMIKRIWQADKNNTGHIETQKEKITSVHFVNRQYQYLQLSTCHLYHLRKIKIHNEAMSTKRIELNQDVTSKISGLKKHFHILRHKIHLLEPNLELEYPREIKIVGDSHVIPATPDFDDYTWLNQALSDIKVRNDLLKFDNQLILDDRWTPNVTTNPRTSIISKQFENANILYDNANLKTKNKNGYYKSNAQIIFKRTDLFSDASEYVTFHTNQINDIQIHTPVINSSSILINQKYVQTSSSMKDNMNLVLGRPFSLEIHTTGNHIQKKGYYTRNYIEYVGLFKIKFPFDVERDRQIIKANNWQIIKSKFSSIQYRLPKWIKEGKYKIDILVISLPCVISECTAQQYANVNMRHGNAQSSLSVNIIGQMYDFKITDVSDANWSSIFRDSLFPNRHTGIFYASSQPINYNIPIAPGSHPLHKYADSAIAFGSNVKFSVRTIGDFHHPADYIKVKCKYYHVDNRGLNRKEVDIYTKNANGAFVLLTRENRDMLTITMTDPYRMIETNEWNKTMKHFIKRNAITNHNTLLEKEFWHRRSNPFTLGNYRTLKLTDITRVFTGEKPDQFTEQKWHGDISLPSKIYVVTKKFDLLKFSSKQRMTLRNEAFLRSGYIILNIQLFAHKKGNSNPNLVYFRNKTENQWVNEAYSTSRQVGKRTFSFSYGDVIFFNNKGVHPYNNFITN